MCRLLPNFNMTSQGTLFIAILFCAMVSTVFAQSGETASVPLPERCNGKRGDRTVTITCPESDIRVTRFFFHRTLYCKKFGVCQSKATLLDDQASAEINYFQDAEDCRMACNNVVKCPREPLSLTNGVAGMVNDDGVWSEVQEDQRLGLGDTVTFRCDQGYALPDGVWNRTCGKNGSWSGETPSCNVRCPKPKHSGYTVTPLSNYYNIGDQIRVDCMDGHEGSSQWTCLQNGSWDGVLPNCSHGCAPPPVDNSHPPTINTDGTTIRYTYTCLNGYTLLSNFSQNSTLITNTSTLTCTDGVLDGDTPTCTRIEVRSPSGPISARREDGIFYYEIDEDSINVVLTCGLEGVEEQYPAHWRVPTKPTTNEPLPQVSTSDERLTFSTVLNVHAGTYSCRICNVMATVFINVTRASGPSQRPIVTMFIPRGTQKVVEGVEKELRTFITGSTPLDVVWQKDSSNITSSDQYELETTASENAVLSTLVIHGFQASAEGTYQIVANNSEGWTISSETVRLMLQDGESRRQADSSEYSVFCEEDTEKAVVLSGVVRRGNSSDNNSFILRVKKVLRSSKTNHRLLRTRRRIEVHVFSTGDRETLLQQQQEVIISGIPIYNHRGDVDFYTVFDKPILNYTTKVAMEIRNLNC